MGLSSNARLLTITARLTSNEYETQKIANAKLRLATQSQEANMDYIAALDQQKLQMTMFNEGEDTSTKINLTPNVLFQYSEMKNQYLLNNNFGQAMVTGEIAENFKSSRTLHEFLQKSGVQVNVLENGAAVNYADSKLYKKYSQYLGSFKKRDAYMNLYNSYMNGTKKIDVYKEFYNSKRNSELESTIHGCLELPILNDYLKPEDWANMGYGDNNMLTAVYNGREILYKLNGLDDNATQEEKDEVINNYKYIGKYPEGELTNATINDVLSELGSLYAERVNKIAEQQQAEWKCFVSNDNLINDGKPDIKNICETEFEKYKKANPSATEDDYIKMIYTKYENSVKDTSIAELKWSPAFLTEAIIKDKNNNIYEGYQEYKELERELSMMYEDLGEDPTEWFTYDNGDKAQWYTNIWYRLNGESTLKSMEGEKASNYVVLDGRLLDNEKWLQDSIKSGAITIEQGSYDSTVVSDVPPKETPMCYSLRGISWNSKALTSCVDILQMDDDRAIAKAEAEYKRRTAEITAKDEKYQTKLKRLDTEHNALKTEYESIKNIVNKNIERSFKTFS